MKILWIKAESCEVQRTHPMQHFDPTVHFDTPRCSQTLYFCSCFCRGVGVRGCFLFFSFSSMEVFKTEGERKSVFDRYHTGAMLKW